MSSEKPSNGGEPGGIDSPRNIKKSARPKRRKEAAKPWELVEGLKSGERCGTKPARQAGFLWMRRRWPVRGWHRVSDFISLFCWECHSHLRFPLISAVCNAGRRNSEVFKKPFRSNVIMNWGRNRADCGVFFSLKKVGSVGVPISDSLWYLSTSLLSKKTVIE